MFITGPEVIKTVTNEDVTFDDLGGLPRMQKVGVTHFVADSDSEALSLVRDLVGRLPSNNLERATLGFTGSH